MASIMLPNSPGLSGAKIRLLDWSGKLTPWGGGITQTIQRLGTRSSVEYKLPRMPSEPTGRIWGMKLREAKLSGVIVPFIQDGFEIGAPGFAATVDGGGQSGMTIAIEGVTPSYPFYYGQAFNVMHGGRHYLQFVSEQTMVGADGKVTLQTFPMLRIIPTDGAQIKIADVMIEGSLSGNEVSWDVGLEPFVDLGTIRIDEDA